MAGATRNRATAVLATIGPSDTRQIGVDNTVIASMRCAVGYQRNKGAAIIV